MQTISLLPSKTTINNECLQMENPFPFARKELADFSLHSKRLTLSLCALTFSYLTEEKKILMQSGMIIYLLKHYHKVSQRSETLAIPQRPRPRKRLRHKAASLFIAFPFALIQPLWLVAVQSLKQFRYLA